MVDGRAWCYGFLVSLTCANLVLTVELVAPKEGERWGKGYVSNKQCSEGLCQGLARFVLVSPTCSKKRSKKCSLFCALLFAISATLNKQILLTIFPAFGGLIMLNNLAFMSVLEARGYTTPCILTLLTVAVAQMSKQHLNWESVVVSFSQIVKMYKCSLANMSDNYILWIN